MFPDRTLQELARVLPVTVAQLDGLRGIGPAKARMFGAEAVAVIARVVQQRRKAT